MAGLDFAKEGQLLETLLGSCVGIVLWDRARKHGALAHIMLSDSAGRSGSVGKYADTAIPAMIQQLRSWGSLPSDLVSKIAGGATMFGSRTANDVGEKNIQAVRAHLKRFGVRIVAEHIGGTQGRVIRFNPADGSVQVTIARNVVAVL
ncbi:MAG: chemotaxis protein CheD [Planctomycetota bacterium]|nr:MAG: chemotaxis protein CheD [Planctomycetota bacterium]